MNWALYLDHQTGPYRTKDALDAEARSFSFGFRLRRAVLYSETCLTGVGPGTSSRTIVAVDGPTLLWGINDCVQQIGLVS